MGFEYIYAWLENLEWFFVIGTGISVIFLIVLVLSRISNEIDVDDWRPLMWITVPVLFIFILFDLAPSMEHIQRVRTTVMQPFKGEEKDEKVTYYPSAECPNSLVCSGR